MQFRFIEANNWDSVNYDVGGGPSSSWDPLQYDVHNEPSEALYSAVGNSGMESDFDVYGNDLNA